MDRSLLNSSCCDLRSVEYTTLLFDISIIRISLHTKRRKITASRRKCIKNFSMKVYRDLCVKHARGTRSIDREPITSSSRASPLFHSGIRGCVLPVRIFGNPRTREERIVIRDPFTARRSLARNRQCAVIFVGDSAILETLICRGYRRGLSDSRTRPKRKGWWIAFTANAKTEGSAPLIPLMSCPPRQQAWLCASHSLCLSNVFRLADPISWIASLLLPPVSFKRSLGIFGSFQTGGISDLTRGLFNFREFSLSKLSDEIIVYFWSCKEKFGTVVAILLAPSRKNRRHNFRNNASLFREGVVSRLSRYSCPAAAALELVRANWVNELASGKKLRGKWDINLNSNSYPLIYLRYL